MRKRNGEVPTLAEIGRMPPVRAVAGLRGDALLGHTRDETLFRAQTRHAQDPRRVAGWGGVETRGKAIYGVRRRRFPAGDEMSGDEAGPRPESAVFDDGG